MGFGVRDPGAKSLHKVPWPLELNGRLCIDCLSVRLIVSKATQLSFLAGIGGSLGEANRWATR
jgi:hypothetical protein